MAYGQNNDVFAFYGLLDSCCRNNLVSHHMVSHQSFMQALAL